MKKEELTAVAKRHGAEPSKFSSQLKGDLDWIVMKCLEKDRTRRFETANGLAFDLKRYLNNEMVLARPPSAAYRFQKLVRRKDQVVWMRFSPDQKMIASGSWDATVRLWEASTGTELAVLTGHKAGVMNGIFSPDGRTLVTGSDDRTIRFWNVATRREVASIQLGSSPYCFAFSPDGQILMANAGDSALRCWRAPSLADIDAAEAKVKAAIKQP